MFCFPSQEYCDNFISTLQRQMSGSGTCPGVRHPEVAKSAGGTGFYPEVTNSALFNIEDVKPVINCFRLVVCLNSSLEKFSWLVQR